MTKENLNREKREREKKRGVHDAASGWSAFAPADDEMGVPGPEGKLTITWTTYPLFSLASSNLIASLSILPEEEKHALVCYIDSYSLLIAQMQNGKYSFVIKL